LFAVYIQFSVDDWGCHYFQLINVILHDFLCELNISFPRRETSVTDDFLFRIVVQTGKFCAKIDRKLRKGQFAFDTSPRPVIDAVCKQTGNQYLLAA